MLEKDTYKTISTASNETLFKDKNSKFYGYAYPINSTDEVKLILKHLKKQHHAARHWCYAYVLGTKTKTHRVNDDGEPGNTAGMPIYRQIQSFNLTNTLVVVVRYFGGVKLGVSGLINAYKNSALITLQSCNITENTININYAITFNYDSMNKVMQIVKEKRLHIINQKFEISCYLEISVREKDAKTVFNIFNNLYLVNIKELV